MSAPTMRSTLLLTEHLQYPAVSLVDDIINAVNEIMYKCTAAMEKYLVEKREVEGKDYTDEIKVGIAKLETLLENSVDKNFDKLELYVLRNVLRIPQELLDANVFRLKYQRDLIIASKSQQEESMTKLNTKVREIEEAFAEHDQLKMRIERAKKLSSKLKLFKKNLNQLFECKNDETKEIFKSLKPLDDSLKLITSQLRQMYLDSEEYGSIEKIDDLSNLEKNSKLRPLVTSRSDYIDTRAELILKKLMVGETQTEEQNVEGKVELTDLRHIDIENPDISVLH